MDLGSIHSFICNLLYRGKEMDFPEGISALTQSILVQDNAGKENTVTVIIFELIEHLGPGEANSLT